MRLLHSFSAVFPEWTKCFTAPAITGVFWHCVFQQNIYILGESSDLRWWLCRFFPFSISQHLNKWRSKCSNGFIFWWYSCELRRSWLWMLFAGAAQSEGQLDFDVTHQILKKKGEKDHLQWWCCNSVCKFVKMGIKIVVQWGPSSF